MRIRVRVNIFTILAIEVSIVGIKEAIVRRFQQICKERNLKYNELATRAGVTPSTVYSMMDDSRKDLSVITVKKLCDGLDMTIPEFFDTEEFRTLPQEMK